LTELRSNKSAFKLKLPVSSSFTEPPTAKTRPSGKIAAFISMRGCDMFNPYTHFGVAAPMSMISVVLVAGLFPPMIMILGS